MALATYTGMDYFMRQRIIDLPELQRDIEDVIAEIRGQADGKK